ncbi:hypothetical protein LshimejAT787_0901120 [Lyophyllum shimeji]|uniref:Uncharacterized protein n=1 Tax=Lyophyllum shimeji TaxID=47721 RepID=A0A9P3PQN3_LYOSH|nr:hypothetical protein LshimejAT787_0901120 [Lyophyllum shimeji]
MDLLDLTVTVWYRGLKAKDFYPDSPLGIKILREDLLSLKLPHPKIENITIKQRPNGVGECVFVWPAAPHGGVLYKHLTGRIWGRDHDGARKLLLDELSISKLSLHEEPHQASAFRTKERTEPIDPPIPDSPARDSVASSIPSPRAPELSFGAHSIEGDFGSPMSISSSWTSPAPKPIKIQPISPTIPPLPLAHSEPDFELPGLTMSTRARTQAHSTEVRTQTLPANQIPPRTQIHPVPRVPSPGALPANAAAVLASTSGPPAVVPTHDQYRHKPRIRTAAHLIGLVMAKVALLTRELWDVRRQIMGGVARETAIMSELRALDPENSNLSTKALEDSAMRARLQEVEAKLIEERNLRMQAEAALADVQRECKEPFVVPALFEAFAMISKATTQVVDSLASEATTT